MRGLKITLFVLGLLTMGTQTFRHVYVKWIEPSGSVLDAYQAEVEEDIAASDDLDELTAHFEKAHEARKAYETDHQDVPAYQRLGVKAFDDEQKLRAAIKRVEGQRKSIFDLWFYWLCGLASIVLGILAYRRVNRWLGMAGMITGFSEMAWWTSPLWRTWGPQGEFDRLLTMKLLLSFVSLALLIAIWLKSDRGGEASESSRA